MGIISQKLKSLFVSMSIFFILNNATKDDILKPYINLDEKFWININPPGVSSNFHSEIETYNLVDFSIGKFYSYVGLSKEEMDDRTSLANFINPLYPLKDSSYYKTINYKDYKIEVYTKAYPYIYKNAYISLFKNKGVYIFDKNNLCIGYLSVGKGELLTEDFKKTSEAIKMKTLEKSKNYLGKQLIIPKKDITFYKYEKNDYIERYALNDKFMYLDSFYPKKLDRFMSNIVLDTLNFNYTSINNPNKYKGFSKEQFLKEENKIGAEPIKLKDDFYHDENDYEN